MTALINNSAFDESGIQRPIRSNRLRNRRRMIMYYYFNRFQERIYGLTYIILLLLNISFKLHDRDSKFRPTAGSALTVQVMHTAESRRTDSKIV